MQRGWAIIIITFTGYCTIIVILVLGIAPIAAVLGLRQLLRIADTKAWHRWHVCMFACLHSFPLSLSASPSPSLSLHLSLSISPSPSRSPAPSSEWPPFHTPSPLFGAEFRQNLPRAGPDRNVANNNATLPSYPGLALLLQPFSAIRIRAVDTLLQFLARHPVPFSRERLGPPAAKMRSFARRPSDLTSGSAVEHELTSSTPACR